MTTLRGKGKGGEEDVRKPNINGPHRKTAYVYML